MKIKEYTRGTVKIIIICVVGYAFMLMLNVDLPSPVEPVEKNI